MTPEEAKADADEAAIAFARLIASKGSESTGIPKPPQIEVSEVRLDTELVPFKMNRGGESRVFRGAPPQPPPAGCSTYHVSLAVEIDGFVAVSCGTGTQDISASVFDEDDYTSTDPFPGCFYGARYDHDTALMFTCAMGCITGADVPAVQTIWQIDFDNPATAIFMDVVGVNSLGVLTRICNAAPNFTIQEYRPMITPGDPRGTYNYDLFEPTDGTIHVVAELIIS